MCVYIYIYIYTYTHTSPKSSVFLPNLGELRATLEGAGRCASGMICVSTYYICLSLSLSLSFSLSLYIYIISYYMYIYI